MLPYGHPTIAPVKLTRHSSFSRLYRGITAPILMEAPKRFNTP